MSNDNHKFRVWDKQEKKYINDCFSLLDRNGDLIFIAGILHLLNESEKERYVIEFCAGIRDKNGQLIYLGDKICFKDAKVEGVVVFVKGAFCFKWKSNTFLLHHIVENVNGQIDNHDLEIIGNIHEVDK